MDLTVIQSQSNHFGAGAGKMRVPSRVGSNQTLRGYHGDLADRNVGGLLQASRSLEAAGSIQGGPSASRWLGCSATLWSFAPRGYVSHHSGSLMNATSFPWGFGDLCP